ncbi:hypothetical protein GYMLUDRAFT_35838, partial [Collybiopsis luxurians FD-317 M1]
MSSTSTPLNVIFFGSTGCGKSSVVNMLLDRQSDIAPTSSGAKGCTFDSTIYSATIDGKKYQFFDTSGLDEGSMGTVVTKDALVKLYQLLRDLQDGISLLVYCMRGPRITETLERNYRVFYEGFCNRNVPVVIVVTGLEDQEPDMETWWDQNKKAFGDYDMHFNGHACITATRGKMRNGQYRNQAEYDESKEILRDLIVDQCQNANPWKMDPNSWFARILRWLHHNLPHWIDDHIDPRLGDLYEALKQYLPESDARYIASQADMKPRKPSKSPSNSSDPQRLAIVPTHK